MTKRALTGVAAVLAAVFLSGCGGGGGEGNTNTGTALGTMKNTITITSPAFRAGQSINISSRATMRGAAPSGMKWSVSPLSGDAGTSSLVISDADCSAATYSPPLFGNDSGVGVCQTVLTASASAKAGKWRITNVASSTTGTIADSVDVELFGTPPSGFSLIESSTPVQAFVGKTASLSMPFTVAAGSTVKNVKYKWTAAAGNPSIATIVGASSSTATIIPAVAGTYLFNVSVSADINDNPEVATGEMAVMVGAATVADQISAGTSQVVGAGTVVLLQGRILNAEPSGIYATSWRQVDGVAGGPIAVTLLNKDSSDADFLSPAIAGTYVFEYRVVKTQANGAQVTTTAQTSVRVMVATPSVFSVSAGDMQRAKVGDIVALKGSVAQGAGGGAGVTYLYAWTQIGTTPEVINFTNANTDKPTFAAMKAGIYSFRLTVTANSSSGIVTVTGDTQVLVDANSVVINNFLITADAGPSQAVVTSAVATLSGSKVTQGVDTGVTYSYQWAQTGTTPAVVSLSNASTKTASFYPTVAGVYSFQLTVTATLPGGEVRTALSSTQVIVGNAGAAFTITADAGPAQIVAASAVATLSGSKVTQGVDTGVTYSYQWAQTGATPAVVSLSNANTKTATFVPTVAGTYGFQLTVTATLPSGEIRTAVSTTQVLVNASATPVDTFAITVDAGPVQAVATNAVTKLTGSKVTQGTDTGVTYSYLWTQVGASPAVVALSNSSTLVASFYPTVAGVYSFQLTVTATLPGGGVRTAVSTTQVIAGSVGSAFSVSAGDAQAGPVSTAKVMTGVVTKQGSFDGATFGYSWTQVGALPAVVTISNANALTASFVPTVAGTYTFMLSVTLTRDGVATTQTAQVQILVI